MNNYYNTDYIKPNESKLTPYYVFRIVLPIPILYISMAISV